MRALCYVAILLAFAGINSAENLTKITSIDLGFNASYNPVSYGNGDMYYTLQTNGTIVAVNLTSRTVAFHIHLPGHVGYGSFGEMAASRSGYLACNPDSARVLVFDPKGKPVCSHLATLHNFHQWGEDSIVFVRHYGDTQAPAGLIAFNLKTCQETVLLKIDTLGTAYFPPPGADPEDTTVVLEEPPIVTSYGLTNVFEYNYGTNTPSWVIHNVSGYRGMDSKYIFVSNATRGGFSGRSQHQLLVYSKATLKKEAQLGNDYVDVGLGRLVVPMVHGGLISIVSGEDSIRLDIVNMSSGVIVQQQRHLFKDRNIPGVGPTNTNNVVLAGTHLVSWSGWATTMFSVIPYPDGGPQLNVKTKHTPDFVNWLPGTDLILATFGSFLNKIEVRNLKTGAAVYDQKLTLEGNHGHPVAPYVWEGMRLVVVTNGTNADVFQY